MGGGAARSRAGNRAPTTNHNIMASSAKVLHLDTERRTLAAMKTGQAAPFSCPVGVLGCYKRGSIPTSPSTAPAQARTAPRALPVEWDVLLCLSPLPHKLWASQIPVLPLPSSMPATTAGFSSFPTQSWAGRSLQTKSVTATGVEPGWRSPTAQKCFYLRRGTSSSIPFLPPCQPCRVPSPPGSAQQVSLQGSSTKGHVETSAQRLETRRKEQYKVYLYRAAPSLQRVIPRTGTGAADKEGGSCHKDKPRSQRWSAWRTLPTPEKSPQGFLALLSSQGA